MFETNITFLGKQRKVRFGAWVTGNIEKLVNEGMGAAKFIGVVITLLSLASLIVALKHG